MPPSALATFFFCSVELQKQSFISGKALLSFVRNVCICYSASSSFSQFLYGVTKPESLRLETLLLIVEWCLSLWLANCAKTHNTE